MFRHGWRTSSAVYQFFAKPISAGYAAFFNFRSYTRFGYSSHPTQPQQVAIGAKEGLFLSRDSGQTFQQIGTRAEVYGVWFDLNGNDLWYAGIKFSPFLIRRNLKTQQEQFIALPSMGRDAVDYIAQNPAQKDEYAISTFQRHVYITRDAGKTWKQIASQGVTQ